MPTIAESIMATPDRTLKERRDMAEFRAVPHLGGKTEWMGRDGEACHFWDGSALLMTFDEDLCPTEFLVVNPSSVEVEGAAAEMIKYAQSVADYWRHLGAYEMMEQVEAHLESNYPEADDDVIAGVVARVH